MNRSEKALYHQIHPAKLAVDWGFGILSLVSFWQHNLVLGILVAFVPSILTSYIIIRTIDLHRYKESAFGRYVSRYMTPWMQIFRMIGFISAVFGAWYHDALIIALGFAIIMLAWLNGYFAHTLRFATKLVRASRTEPPTNLPR